MQRINFNIRFYAINFSGILFFYFISKSLGNIFYLLLRRPKAIQTFRMRRLLYLQRLHDIALAKCKENNIDPEKCYINWWIDY